MNLQNSDLALNGGQPIRSKPWKDNFTTDEREKLAVARVLDSGYLSLFEGSATPAHPFSFYGGPEVRALEKEWASYYHCKHAVSVNSATSGLYMAIGALGIGYGDEVIVSPYTMSACALAPLIYGAIPVFADVDINSGSLDPKSIKEKISPRTKAILVVHQFGIPARMKEIMNIAREFDLAVIEDCAQAHGAMVDGQYVGTIGDIGVFSLNVNKSIQTGEGGVCLTNNEDLFFRLCLIRNHGEACVDGFDTQDITNIAGFNYRLTEIQAAIARVQLEKLDEFNAHRLELVERLKGDLQKFDFLKLLEPQQSDHATYYVVPIRFNPQKAQLKREEFVQAVNAEGILFYQGYVKPLYLQRLYQRKELFKGGYPFTSEHNKDCNMEYGQGLCPNTELLHYNEIIINEHIRHPHTVEDIDDILIAIEKVVG